MDESTAVEAGAFDEPMDSALARCRWLLYFPPLLGPVIAAAIALPSPRSGAARLWISSLQALGAHVLIGLVITQFFPPLGITAKAKEAELKQCLFNIHVAVEEYSEENGGSFPSAVSEVLREGYLDRLPSNSFLSTGSGHGMLREIPYGAAPQTGEFSYITGEDETGAPQYWLLVYGRERNEGIDVDGDGKGDRVLFVIGNGKQHVSAGGGKSYYDAKALAQTLKIR